MSTTVSNIFSEARALLNDLGASIFTDTALLPLLKKAYQELQDELILNSSADFKEQDDTVFLSNGAVTTIDPAVILPDLLYPLQIWEKSSNANPDTDYELMTEFRFGPDVVQEQKMRYWYWADEKIQIPGCLTNGIVLKVKYLKLLPALVDVNSSIPIINCQTFLASRLAAIAAFSIGGNPDRAEVHNADANLRLTKIIQTLVKRQQNLPGRRQPFNPQSGR